MSICGCKRSNIPTKVENCESLKPEPLIINSLLLEISVWVAGGGE